MSDSSGFYLISDFHVDLNYLADPKHVEGSILYSDQKEQRVVKTIYDWSGIPATATVVFSGDTSNSSEVSVKVWKECAQHVRNVLVLPGNHEYYYPRWRTVKEADAIMRAGISDAPGIKFLESHGTTFLHEGTLFLGCVGWYNWDACPEYDKYTEMQFWKDGSNDSRMIQYDSGYPDVMAHRDADWLRMEVAKAQDRDDVKRIVILTHTCPRPEFLVPSGHPWYRLNGSYANTHMMDVPESDTKKKIKVWGYGHSHYRKDVTIDGIRYLNNARGYAGESTVGRESSDGWKPIWVDLGADLTVVETPYTTEPTT